MKKTLFSLLLFILTPLGLMAQSETETLFRQSGKIYVVVTILSVIFIGIIIYMILIDRRLSRIEKERKDK